MKKALLTSAFLVFVVNLIIFLAPVVKAMDLPLSNMPYLIFSKICHQLPERSFFILSQPMPVCSRCAGLYLGALAAFIFAFFTVPKSPSNLQLFLALLPMAFDGGTQLLGLRESNNIIRLITGLIAGLAVSMLFVDYLYKKLD